MSASMHLATITLVVSLLAANARAAATGPGPLVPQRPCARARAHTKRSLALADHIYLESRLRSKTLRTGIQTDGASLSPRIESYPHLMVWDLFTPEYNCPDHKSRMGKIGDGGKWVCGQHTLLQQAGCVVYSIGSAGETSFEQEVLARTPCTLHAFDPTLTAQQAKEVAAVVGDRNFHSVGLGVDDGRLGTMPTKKLATIMKDLGHEWVDVLKMDIEGGEWQVLKGLLAQGPIAAGQILVEFHVGEVAMATMLEVLDGLEAAGYRVFSIEPNYYVGGAEKLVEMAFVKRSVFGSSF